MAINYNDIHKYEGFKLVSLQLEGNTLMGKSKLYYNFVELEDEQTEIYTTVLIGANGTGKSNLFRIIIELFKELYDLSFSKQRSYNVDGRFKLKFSIHGDIFEYGNMSKENLNLQFNFAVSSRKNEKTPAYLLKNDEKINFSEAQFPLAIVANSISLTDKFPFFKKELIEDGELTKAFPQYKYLGVRNIAQNASTRAYVRKTVEFIVEQKDSIAFRAGLEKATKFLGLDKSIQILYTTANTFKFFKGDLTPSIMDEYFDTMKIKYSNKNNRPPDKLTNYFRIAGEKILIERICNFCNELVKEKRLISLSPSAIKLLSYNIMDNSSFQQLQKEFEMLEYLRQLGMISPPEIKLQGNDGYSLQESSSGEYHFFSSVVGLMATVKINSLVFIDEPEISLHPNWQMKYLTFIRELFSSPEYATSHILVATHSHFLLSDLKGVNSKIIGLKKENRVIEIVDLPRNIDTYGWSAENVLLNVFNLPTTRNYYVAERIGIILKKAAANSDLNEYKDELLGYRNGLKEEDPLHYTITKIAEKLKWLV